ncbi:class I adenylate-forming enzyme family protein [Facilibium subflavum]|uniref:class I adenylate-forming enzyme family protein n=1 Tax=Facilibium subflavum TaxID=2219058 RepID=UPI000E64E63A|nr:class I adenylate-forming enzyme family protein [Facilibium subflavum]
MLAKLLTQWQDQEKKALSFGNKHYSYKQLANTSTTLANNLYQQGLRKGMHLALFMDNRPELIWLYFAAFHLGVVIIPINYRFKAEELGYVLQDCQADMLIVDKEKLPHVEKVSKTQILNCRVFALSKRKKNYFHYFSDLLNDTTPAFLKPKIQETDLAMILYTSGSTAKPKGVMHSYKSIFAAAKQLTETISQDNTAVHAITLPICHIAGFVGQVISTVMLGGHMYLFKRFDAEKLAKAISQCKITHLQLVPANLNALIDAIDQNNHDLSTLQCVMVGGDKVSPSSQQHFYQLTHCKITEVIGMTESFSYCINLSNNKAKTGAIGQPAKGVKIALIDHNNNLITQADTVGEIMVSTNANMLGYWQKPKATKKALQNQWLFTGDLSYQGKDGFYWFVGRKKQLIIRAGSNISPQEVENIISQHPDIKEVSIIGIPDKTLGQQVCACIVLKDDKKPLTLKTLKDFCQDKLSDYKIPEKLFIFQSLPHNATGKLDREKIAKSVLPA